MTRFNSEQVIGSNYLSMLVGGFVLAARLDWRLNYFFTEIDRDMVLCESPKFNYSGGYCSGSLGSGRY
jgi:hypothetical protein